MKMLSKQILSMALIATVFMTACTAPSQEPEERYVSSQVQGEAAKINLEEVQKAFWDTKAKDFQSWMNGFEKRVNEVYEGEGVVSIDASRKKEKLTVTGYIDNNKEAGYQDGEEKLFSIEQTGDVADNQLPYRVSDQSGRPYYEGHHSILDNPFVQMMVLSHLMSGWGGRYHTPYAQTSALQGHRDSFRSTPAYNAQKTANTDFNSRFKQKSGGGFASKKGFGSGTFSTSTSTQKRGWGGFSSSSSSSKTTIKSSPWGGRRSPFGSSRGWGGRRRWR